MAKSPAKASFAGRAAPDGRRPFGSVRDAIVQVLAEADGDLRVRDIHPRVERLLSGPVSPTSVKAYLRRGCSRPVPLFEYRGRRGYRLRGDSSGPSAR
jgi:hypothetical protein